LGGLGVKSTIDVVAIIPARGGSKGLPRKNLAEIRGQSLVSHALKFARDSELFGLIHLSTDSEEIAAEGDKWGLRPTFLRSESTSHDSASSTEVIREVRAKLLDLGVAAQRFVLLEPTSPMRRLKFVAAAIAATRKDFDASVTVSPVDVKFHPDKQFVLAAEEEIAFFSQQGRAIVARQQLKPTYIRNGFCYVITDLALAEGRDIFGSRCKAIICDIDYVNIDNQADLDRCRILMQ
jgi:CMP-N-acetylneuraminic acid synthetase